MLRVRHEDHTSIPKGTMYDGELLRYAHLLKIPGFRGVKMRDELPNKPHDEECGILNLNTHLQKGSHWTCWYKNGGTCYYFDSFAETPPIELEKYIKSTMQVASNAQIIHRNAVTVQHEQSEECGSLCLNVLKMLFNGIEFPEILTSLLERHETFPTPPLSVTISR